MIDVRVELADITTLAVDAIVNAANELMLGGGGVDGAIHDAAGPELLEACRRVPEVRPGVRCPCGEARVTPGFDLPARYVIHTVGPVWRGGQRGERELLAACYRSIFAVCAPHAIRSIAIPAISCGAFGFPLRTATSIVVHEIQQARAGQVPLDLLVLVAFDSATYEIIDRALHG